MKSLIYQRVLTEDDAHLATDVWLPDGPGPFPVLLTRTPYHRAGALGKAREYTSWGYAYVVQDTRGKYDSTGPSTTKRSMARPRLTGSAIRPGAMAASAWSV